MIRWLRRRGLLDVETSDNMWLPGRRATLTLGPFEFMVDTADGRVLGVWLDLGRVGFGWFAQGDDRKPTR